MTPLVTVDRRVLREGMVIAVEPFLSTRVTAAPAAGPSS
jgi:methionine aminopeptidase